MDSTTETTPSGNDNSTLTSPPADSSTSPPPPDTSPPPQSPPLSSNSSPPPPDSSSSSSSSSSSPPPDSSSPPPPDSSGSSSPSPPPPESNSSPSPPPPPTTSTPAQSPPPNNPASPPPTNSGTPTAPTTPPVAPGFSPPPPGAVPSHTPPSPVLSPSRPRSPSAGTPSGSSSQANVSKTSSSSDNSNIAIVAGIIGGVVLLLAAIIVGLICLRKKKKQRYYMEGELPQRKAGSYHMNRQKRPSPMNHNIVNNTPSPALMGTPGGSWGAVAPPSSEFSSTQSPKPYNQSEFTYEELAAATGGFSQANVLGQGGFGFVHKGVLPSGVEVAVKSLKAGSGQGEREFQAEVDIISRVHHRHLVSLVGYCIADQQRMLVYQFVPNKTLEFHLHGKGNPVMDWRSRLRISIGSAKGLAYLHEDCQPRIIHRDIKAANILLDFNFEAMVADFGLAKLTSDNFTHVSTRVMGTFGYLAPEYAASGKLTEKSDVFSFGVMLLELITGRRPVDPTRRVMDDSLVDWARPLLSKVLEDGNYKELVDPRLEDSYDPHEMARMVACASASIRHSARRRPRMSQIVRTLEGASSLEDLNEKPVPNVPLSPAKVPMSSSVYDTRAYNADIVKFRQMIQDGNSSEYGATTSEYGLNPSSSSSDSRETDVSSIHKESR